MSSSLIDTTVGQLVTERPSRALLFERLGVDYCCGGKRRLVDACARAGLDPATVLQQMTLSDARTAPSDETDWSRASMTALVQQIVSVHHTYLREALPQLAAMLEKVVHAHGEGHPELTQLRDEFGALDDELESHMVKEERILFPLCRALEEPEGARTGGLTPAQIACPIRQMIAEHEDAGDHLAAMRRLTAGFTPPPDACGTYRALLAGLHELEQDLHRHIHLENNILFPKAAAAAGNPEVR